MSSLRVNAITDTSGGSTNLTVSGKNTAKAWVNFNGTGTVAIRSQFNVSSITDNAVGDYTVNFTSALADANYSCVATGNFSGNVAWVATPYSGTTPTTTNIRIRAVDAGGAADLSYMNATIFGN